MVGRGQSCAVLLVSSVMSGWRSQGLLERQRLLDTLARQVGSYLEAYHILVDGDRDGLDEVDFRARCTYLVRLTAFRRAHLRLLLAP